MTGGLVEEWKAVILAQNGDGFSGSLIGGSGRVVTLLPLLEACVATKALLFPIAPICLDILLVLPAVCYFV
ncbi:hypothetical protein A7P94_03015 [Eikenella sp. NML01-A-086]|nr:hypothetical protein A7P94_03015 [Eikenella sp. NML01-A-086]OAM40891.1 hypothetical protein A7Q02_05945 [Eikenella sp. NML97-A-109]